LPFQNTDNKPHNSQGEKGIDRLHVFLTIHITLHLSILWCYNHTSSKCFKVTSCIIAIFRWDSSWCQQHPGDRLLLLLYQQLVGDVSITLAPPATPPDFSAEQTFPKRHERSRMQDNFNKVFDHFSIKCCFMGAREKCF
jgi:hypothetical protein